MLIQLGSGGSGKGSAMGKKATLRLKGAENYPVWWLRFKAVARAQGFERLLKFREKYSEEVKKDAASMKLKAMKLAEAEDVSRDAGEKFDTPAIHRSVSEDESQSGSDMSGAKSDESSGLDSVATHSVSSRGSRKKMRTIDSKVRRKHRKLFDLVIHCVSDEIAMKLERKASEDGVKALREIEKLYAGKSVDRVDDLKSDMKDLDPDHFTSFGDYMEAILQIQAQLEIVGWPVEESMIKVFIRDKAPSDYKSFIATISRSSLDLEDWCEEISTFSKSFSKTKKEGKSRKLLACQSRKWSPMDCQLCGQSGHLAPQCIKSPSAEKRSCYNCGEIGHIGKHCPKPDRRLSKDHKEAKKAFKAAKKKLHAIEEQVKTSSSESEKEDSSDRYPSSTSSSSSDGGIDRVVAGRRARVISNKAGKKKKTYKEATSPSSSEDSHLSWDEYNAKASAKLSVIDARLNGELSGTTRRKLGC